MELDGNSVPSLMPNLNCKRPSDPYEFDDDGMVPPVAMESFKRNPPQVKVLILIICVVWVLQFHHRVLA